MVTTWDARRLLCECDDCKSAPKTANSAIAVRMGMPIADLIRIKGTVWRGAAQRQAARGNSLAARGFIATFARHESPVACRGLSILAGAARSGFR
jgi:hypothetical protein